MELLIWIVIFIIALAFLVKGADWFVQGSEKLGLILGLSPFVIGVTIVALGTSLPELITALFAVYRGATEIAVANAVGSNIANVLLILGISSIAAGKLVIRHSLIDIDLPLVLIATVLFLGTAWDKVITWQEAFLLLAAFVVYLIYAALQRKGENISREVSILPKEHMEDHDADLGEGGKDEKPRFHPSVIIFLLVGGLGLFLGSKYVVEATLNIAEILAIAPSVIAIFAIAIGTSLPELVVSVQAAMRKKYELAVGNILGSNVFNILAVVGIPAFIKDLVVDETTFTLGLPLLALSTLFLVISGISQRIHKWEGAMFLIIYVFFVGKLFNLL